MRILQLCCFTNHWGPEYDVLNIDTVNGDNVLDFSDSVGKSFDFILGAPPCTQFTKANQHNWLEYPELDIQIAKKCFDICKESKKPFVIENPPGRIEKFLPDLVNYRVLTFNDKETNKEWVLYSNILLISPGSFRYGKKSISNQTKNQRLAYPKYFIDSIKLMARI